MIQRYISYVDSSIDHTHPAKKEGAQPVEIAPHSDYMVPKPGFEPGQAYAH